MKSPYENDLQESVTKLYQLFGKRKVSKDLEVCNCSVCMHIETQQEIIKTPNWQLNLKLIHEYSNSAHGVPNNLQDLRILLPRYLEILSQDELVDYIGVGTELSRFGEAKQLHKNLYTKQQQQELDKWATLMILHFGYLKASKDDNLYSPINLTEVLICGGWEVSTVTSALEKLFTNKEIGNQAIIDFAKVIVRDYLEDNNSCLDFFALKYCDEPTKS